MYNSSNLIQSKSSFYLQQSAHNILSYFHYLKGQPIYESMLNCHSKMTEAICNYHSVTGLDRQITYYGVFIQLVIEFKTMIDLMLKRGLEFPGMAYTVMEVENLYRKLQEELLRMRVYQLQIKIILKPNNS